MFVSTIFLLYLNIQPKVLENRKHMIATYSIGHHYDQTLLGMLTFLKNFLMFVPFTWLFVMHG